uniref:Uncharacterized protein n=1 Tax=Romanomermis culicivorax TaxID=13658 RepID=A0A915JR05_ROMCU
MPECPAEKNFLGGAVEFIEPQVMLTDSYLKNIFYAQFYSKRPLTSAINLAKVDYHLNFWMQITAKQTAKCAIRQAECQICQQKIVHKCVHFVFFAIDSRFK